MGATIDLDRATDRAWRMVELDWARRIADYNEDEQFLVELDAPDRETVCTPYVQVGYAAVGYQVEVVSNRYVDERYRLDKTARRALRDAGWRKPSSDRSLNYWFPVDRGDVADAEEAARLMVFALREVYGVPHPAFLVDSDDLVEVDDFEELGAEQLAPPVATSVLHRQVADALAAEFGHEVRTDPDGDFPFICGRSVVFVSVLDEPTPTVRLWARLVEDVTEPERAAYEVGVLNRDFRWAKFVLLDDVIHLRQEVLAAPFASDHLQFTLREVCDWVAKYAPDVAYRAGGRCFLEEPTEDAR